MIALTAVCSSLKTPPMEENIRLLTPGAAAGSPPRPPAGERPLHCVLKGLRQNAGQWFPRPKGEDRTANKSRPFGSKSLTLHLPPCPCRSPRSQVGLATGLHFVGLSLFRSASSKTIPTSEMRPAPGTCKTREHFPIRRPLWT